jgi:hypothetical protein
MGGLLTVQNKEVVSFAPVVPYALIFAEYSPSAGYTTTISSLLTR